MRGWITVLALAGAVSLAGCAGYELRQARNMTPEGDQFQKGLYDGYVELASAEYAEGDSTDTRNFAKRAKMAGMGEPVEPEMIDARKLPAGKSSELTDARQRLMTVMAKGAVDEEPAEAARAQTMFDCWMQEQEENFQPNDIARCREGFNDSIAKIELAMAPPAAAPVVVPETVPAESVYVVYFDFDSDEISEAAASVLAAAVKAADEMEGATINVDGHTDLVGPELYNLGLSERRAEAVRNALIAQGVDDDAISMSAYGFNRPAIETAPGVSEEGNRRVEITIR